MADVLWCNDFLLYCSTVQRRQKSQKSEILLQKSQKSEILLVKYGFGIIPCSDCFFCKWPGRVYMTLSGIFVVGEFALHDILFHFAVWYTDIMTSLFLVI